MKRGWINHLDRLMGRVIAEVPRKCGGTTEVADIIVLSWTLRTESIP